MPASLHLFVRQLTFTDVHTEQVSKHTTLVILEMLIFPFRTLRMIGWYVYETVHLLGSSNSVQGILCVRGANLACSDTRTS